MLHEIKTSESRSECWTVTAPPVLRDSFGGIKVPCPTGFVSMELQRKMLCEVGIARKFHVRVVDRRLKERIFLSLHFLSPDDENRLVFCIHPVEERVQFTAGIGLNRLLERIKMNYNL